MAPGSSGGLIADTSPLWLLGTGCRRVGRVEASLGSEARQEEAGLDAMDVAVRCFT